LKKKRARSRPLIENPWRSSISYERAIMKTRGLSHWRRLCRDCGLLPPADGANHAQDIEFTIGASAIQQRSVGLHKQRRRDSSDARFMLTKESEHGRTARALFGDPPGNGGDRLPGALRLTSCYGLLRTTKKLASSKLRASASNSRIVWVVPGTVTSLFVAGCSYGGAKIENEAFVFALARFLIGLSKQRGWVNRCENFWRNLRR